MHTPALLTERLPAREEISLVNVGHLVPTPEWVSRLSAHPFHEIVYVTSGSYRSEVSGKELVMEPGEFLVYPEGCEHAPLHDAQHPSTFFILQWKDTSPGAISQEAMTFRDTSKRVLAMITWIWERYPPDQAAHTQALHSLLHGLVYELHLLTVQTESALIDKVRVHVRRNLSRPLTLDELAEVAGKSRFHFTRLFKQATGFTPMKYVQKTRVDTAISLLMNTELTLKEITLRVGYENPFTLSNLIRREQGLSPRALRKRHESRKTPLPKP